MAPSRDATPPRHYFLNEAHELARGEAPGGGRFQPFRVDWRARSEALVDGFRAVRAQAATKLDPTRSTRFFLVTEPPAELLRESSAKTAVDGVREVGSDDEDATRRLQKLGFDVLQVHADGTAVVHVPANALEQLTGTSLLLGELSERERARWARVSAVRPVERSRKVDDAFLERLGRAPGDALVVVHRVLTELEGVRLAEAIKTALALRRGKLLAGGRDTLGGTWFRVHVDRRGAEFLADSFDSIRLIVPPVSLRFEAATPGLPGPLHATGSVGSATAGSPVVAILDSGVEHLHPALAPHVTRVIPGPPVTGTHGTAVASKIIWGDIDDWPERSSPCRVVDVRVATSPGEADPAYVLERLNAAAINGDARVFNLSLGFERPWKHPAAESLSQAHALHRAAELDFIAFRHDVLLVVAAGNSPEGAYADRKYPQHIESADAGLTAWACGVNTLVCGATNSVASPAGLAGVHEPSPFSRIGPGVAGAAQPVFSAPGGNFDRTWQFAPELGVGVFSTASSSWERRFGTSFAAPLVAREAAAAVTGLQAVCPEGVRVAAGLVKAFLLWSAKRPSFRGRVEQLAKRTIGRGRPSAEPLRVPKDDAALFFWQGAIPDERSTARVRVPVPAAWLARATMPRLRLVAGWNALVNDSVPSTWVCRQLTLRLSPKADGSALLGKSTRFGPLPLVDRTYDLSSVSQADLDDGDPDTFVLSMSYSTVIDPPYPPASPEQRLGVVVELFDAAPAPESPHAAIIEWEQRVQADLDHLTRVDVPTAIPIS